MAARTGSFVAAADLLSVSPGAVSRTVKELENYLGIKLFRRLPRGVELTAVGREYANRIAPAIHQIGEASIDVSHRKRARVLRVTVMPALGERWLVPRLGEFRDEYPDISVEVSADSAVLALEESNFDVALRYGAGEGVSAKMLKLFDDAIFPVMSPDVVTRENIVDHADVFKVPGLQDKYWASDWDAWFEVAGIEPDSDWRLTSFTLYSMALSAAISGQGVVMGHRILVESDLREGRLVEPFELRVALPKSFYCLENANRPRSESVTAFVEWLGGQAGVSG